jgi:peptidoglycan/LPS O-acetylase OafA/YrhL
MRSTAITSLTKQIARYSYGIYLLHYFAIWVAFVVFRRLNVAMRAAIFLAVLVSLSVLLYHTVEAPLIGVGVKVSEKLMRRRFVSGLNRHPIKSTPQIFLDETGSL